MKAIILAGGSGCRLWPLSREMFPKQFLKFDGENSLLQNTFERVNGLVDTKDIVLITNVRNTTDVKLQIKDKSENSIIISEPIGKNTAPAIATSLQYLKTVTDNDETVVITPCDLLIKDIDAFKSAINRAIPLVENGYIVTFGVKPTYPETGFGYIKTDKEGINVIEFREKPDIKSAEIFSQSGYYWNSGIFAGKISVFLDEIKKYASEIFEITNSIDFSKSLRPDYTVYDKMPSISIDYAVLEKSSKIALVELKSDWADLGSWQALYKMSKKDENGNVLTGNVLVDNVKNSFIYSQRELVTATGLENLLLVETEDAIMACDINNTNDVKKIFDKLKNSENPAVQLHKTCFRPWGYYTCLNGGEGYLTKMICVLPHQKLSLQSHNFRSEHWVVLEGEAVIILDDKEIICRAGDSIDIPVKAKHSLQNHTDKNLKIIEVQKGEFISEDDIIRYNDIYGRV